MARMNLSSSMTRMTTSTTTERLAIALGSNLGDREAHLARAVAGLEQALGPLRLASLYENAALCLAAPAPLPGVTAADIDGTVVSASPSRPDTAPRFLNTVVIADQPAITEPRRLLTLTQALERAAGRQPAARWAPRPLDVDILVIGERIVREADLTVPHGGLRERRFVLVPLAEVAPELPIPPDGATAAALSAALAPASHPLERRDWRLASR